jgi:hypothetical protein
VRSAVGAHPATTMTPVVVRASPVPIGPDDSPGGGSYCGTAPASNRSANDDIGLVRTRQRTSLRLRPTSIQSPCRCGRAARARTRILKLQSVRPYTRHKRGFGDTCQPQPAATRRKTPRKARRHTFTPQVIGHGILLALSRIKGAITSAPTCWQADLARLASMPSTQILTRRNARVLLFAFSSC